MIDAYIFVMIGLVIVFLFTTMTDKKLLHISIVGKKSITKQMARLRGDFGGGGTAGC